MRDASAMNDAAYADALDRLAEMINRSTGTAHQTDGEKTVELFRGLIDAGRFVHWEEITDYLKTKHGFGNDEASSVAHVYETLRMAKQLPGNWFPPDYFERILSLPKP
jgi:hypothetical protein